MADPDDVLATLTTKLDALLAPTGVHRYGVESVTAETCIWRRKGLEPDSEDLENGHYGKPYLLLCNGTKVSADDLYQNHAGAELVRLLCGLHPCSFKEHLSIKLDRYYTNGLIDYHKVKSVVESIHRTTHPQEQVTEAHIEVKKAAVVAAVEKLKHYVACVTKESENRGQWELTAIVPFPLSRIREMEQKLVRKQKDIQAAVEFLISVANTK